MQQKNLKKENILFGDYYDYVWLEHHNATTKSMLNFDTQIRIHILTHAHTYILIRQP